MRARKMTKVRRLPCIKQEILSFLAWLSESLEVLCWKKRLSAVPLKLMLATRQ
jgi:hypothetical protein